MESHEKALFQVLTAGATAMRNITNLQVIRGFAATAVVLLHATGTAIDYGYAAPLSAALGGWGASGVDIFFVLSGFIMIYSQIDKSPTPMAFMLGRVHRIAPAYWLMTSILICLLALAPGMFNQLSLDLGHAAVSYLFISRATGFENPYLFVGWTLEYEFLFYLIFALSLLLPSWRVSVLFIIATVAILPLVFPISPILYEFAFGVLLGVLVRRWRPSQAAGVGLLGIGLGLLLLTIALPDPDDGRRVLIWGIPSTMILLGAYATWQTGNRPLIYFGDASYIIYLIQVFTIPAFFKIWNVLGLPVAPGDIMVLACTAGTVISGCVWHSLIDTPVRRFLRRRRRPVVNPA